MFFWGDLECKTQFSFRINMSFSRFTNLQSKILQLPISLTLKPNFFPNLGLKVPNFFTAFQIKPHIGLKPYPLF